MDGSLSCKSLESSGAHKSSMARCATFKQSKDRGAVADMLVSQWRTAIQHQKYLQNYAENSFYVLVRTWRHHESEDSENKVNFKLFCWHLKTPPYNTSLKMFHLMVNIFPNKLVMIY